MSFIAIVGSKGCGVRTATNHLVRNGYTLSKFKNNKFLTNNPYIVVNDRYDTISYQEIRSQGGVIVRIVRYGYPILDCEPHLTVYNNWGKIDLFHALNIYVLGNAPIM